MRTQGPWPGISAPGARVFLDVLEDQTRLLLLVYPDGKYISRRFDEVGWLIPFVPPRLQLSRKNGGLADLDGDGFIDAWEARVSSGLPGEEGRRELWRQQALRKRERQGDLDGGGHAETVSSES